MLRHQPRFSVAWILHWGRLRSLHLPKMLVFPGPFLLTVKIYHHLSSAIQVYYKGVHFGFCHFTDPWMFNFKSSMVLVFFFHNRKNIFVALCPYKFTFLPNSWWIKIQSTEKSFAGFDFYNFALLSINLLLWPCIFYLFPSSCSFFSSLSMASFLVLSSKALTINTACDDLTHAVFALLS